MQIKPVAYFHSPFPAKFGIPRQAGLASELPGRIVFEPEFRSADAVRGLEGFDFLWLIWEFSATSVPEKSPADKTAFRATVRPPRLGGNGRIGVFASRSPFRPNSLGLSSVKIVSVDYAATDKDGKPIGPVIDVAGADLMDGTPVYDIKPYLTYADSHPEARSGFVDEHQWQLLEVVFPEYADRCGVNLTVLREVLAQDPRPSCRKDPGKVYGMAFDGHEVHFRVSGSTLTVLDIQ